VVRLPPKKTRPRKEDGARPGGRHARGNPDSVIPANAGIQDVGWVLNPHGNRQAVPGTPFRFSGRNPGKPSHQLHVSLCRLTAGQDYLGRRVSRTIYGAPNITIKYAYDGDRIIAEYDGSGTLLRKFVYGPGIDEPICLIEVAESNAVYYYHFDGLGSVVALSDVNSVLVERYTYDVFGRPTIRDANGTELAESALANPYLFTGRAYDAETGLYYYRARYYDYATGRFLQPDPTGYTDGLNLYAYVGNNPFGFVDPSGLFREIDIGFKNGKLTMTITVPITYKPTGGLKPEQFNAATARFDASAESRWEAYQGPISIDLVITHPVEGDGQPTNVVWIRPGVGNPIAEVYGDYTLWPLWIEPRYGVWSAYTPGDSVGHEVGHLIGLSDRYNTTTPPYAAWPFFENNIMASSGAQAVEHKTVIELLMQEMFYRLMAAFQKAQQKGCE
jgi:RHS repeat-associated protein